MKINIVNIDKTEDYREGCKDTLFVTSNREVADHLTSKGEAVCICVCDEEQLPAFEGYKYFITEGVQDIGHLNMVYCHQKNIPFVIAESEELTIREECAGDLNLIYDMYEDDECRKYLEALPLTEKRNLNTESQSGFALNEYANERLETVKSAYLLYGYGMWIAEKKETGEVIGRAGFEYVDEHTVSLGFMIKKDERKKGYAKKAAFLCINYLKENYPELSIVARCSRENKASIAILESLNIPFETV